MPKLFSYYCECYGFQSYLFLGSKEDMLNELHKAPVRFNKESLSSLVDSIRSCDAGFTVDLVPEEGVKRYLICMPDFTWSIENIVTLSHEVLHVAQLALLERSITDLSNDSCFHCLIYLRDSLERAFLDKLEKWRKEKEKENMEDNIESVVNPEEESTADVELKKSIEKNKKKKKKS